MAMNEDSPRPRPEKCPFCAAPVEGDELACRQCGFDLESDWQPASEDEAQAVFDPALRACTVCGELNPIVGIDFCAKCGAPVGDQTAQKLDRAFAARSGPLADSQSPASLMIIKVFGWLLIAWGVFICGYFLYAVAKNGWSWEIAAWTALSSLAPFLFGLLLLEVPFKILERRARLEGRKPPERPELPTVPPSEAQPGMINPYVLLAIGVVILLLAAAFAVLFLGF